jgi:hypothetical protein
MNISTHIYTGNPEPNHLKIVERDLPENRIVWVSGNGGIYWTRSTVGDVVFIASSVGPQKQIVLAPDAPEYL